MEAEQEKNCEALLKAKDDLIAIISHQLRTPLTTMRWFLDPLISGDEGAFTSKQREFLVTFSRAAENMISLLDNILNVWKIGSGELKSHPEIVDPAAITKTLCEETRPLLSESQKFQCLCEPDAPAVVADPHMLHEVLYNLLVNAVRYTPSGGQISLSLKLKHSPDAVEFAVQDSGVGIPKNEQHLIFQKMFRASNVSKMFPSGTGLGLYLAKVLTDRIGGKIWFESEIDKGSTFYVSLPANR